MGHIIEPWKKLYLATSRNYACVSKTANDIYKKCKQFIQCCISDRYKTAKTKNIRGSSHK